MLQRYHGGNLKKAAQQFGLEEEGFLDFSANINPLGPPPQVWLALQEAIESIIHYPDPEAQELKAELASYLGASENQVVLGNGGAELIYLVGQFFSPRRVVVTAPTFGEYGQGIFNTKIVRVNLAGEQNFQLDIDSFQDVLQEGDLIFLGNPNNPTGILTPKQQILELASLAAIRGATLVVDEAFMDFVEERQSVVDTIGKFPHLIVVGSLTKIFALPGLRLGYLVAGEAVANRLESLLPPWRINTLAQKAGVVSLRDKEYLQKSQQLIRVERAFLSERLQELGFQPYPGTANFLLVNARHVGMTGEELQKYLGSMGLLIRLCHSFYNLDDYFFRIAVRTREDNEQLLRLLGEALVG